jgi:hypothetical protein
VPPVSGEEAIEALLGQGSARAGDVIAWMAGLGTSERSALASND